MKTFTFYKISRASMLIFFVLIINSICLKGQAPGFAWLQQDNGGADITNSVIAVDKIHHFVYVAGSFQGNYMNFGSSVNANANPSSGSNDIYLAKYTLNGTLVWGKCFGSVGDDVAVGVATDASGNIFIGGHFKNDTLVLGSSTLVNAEYGSLNPISASFMAKLDANGNFLWAKAGVPITANARVSDATGTSTVATDASGNAFLVGTGVDSVKFGNNILSSAYGAFAYVIKYDGSGNLLWAHNSTGLNSNLNPGIVYAETVVIDKDGNCVVAGMTGDDNQFDNIPFAGSDNSLSRFVAKLNGVTGSFLWAQGSSFNANGGALTYGVSSDASGNIYLSGQQVDVNQVSNYFFEKRDPSGNVSWTVHDSLNFTIPITITTDDAGNSFGCVSIIDTVAKIGNYTIHLSPGSFFTVPFINSCPVVIKLDSSGNVDWVKSVTPSLNSQTATTAGGIGVDSSDYVYFTGGMADTCGFDSYTFLGDPANSDMFVAKLGSNGVNGINNVLPDAAGISVYPNPASSTFNIAFAAPVAEAAITVYDMQGKAIFTKHTAGEQKVTLNEAGTLASGTYLCRVVSYSQSNAEPVQSSHLLVVE